MSEPYSGLKSIRDLWYPSYIREVRAEEDARFCKHIKNAILETQTVNDKDFIKNLEQRMEDLRNAEVGICSTCGATKLAGCNGKIQTIMESGFITKHVVCPSYKEAMYLVDESSESASGESHGAETSPVSAPTAAETTNGTSHL
jgi:hypothetical protein